jgi:lipopolysaccharide transport system permease protein
MKVIIEPARSAKNYWQDIWRYRELMYFLAWRDIAVRYKQTFIGVAWALIRPALAMVIFVAFRHMVGISASEVPEPILVFAAILPWQFFASALADSTNSLVSNANLISKVYFPRLIVPGASMVTSLVDFLVTLGLLVVLMFWYRFFPSWQIIILPLFLLLAVSFSFGLGLFLTALNVEYRDFRFIVPFIIQFGLFISPVAYSISNVPESWRMLYALNPMVGVINGFRWCILGGNTPLNPETVGLSVVVTISFLLLGVWYFRRMERSFADVI